MLLSVHTLWSSRRSTIATTLLTTYPSSRSLFTAHIADEPVVVTSSSTVTTLPFFGLGPSIVSLVP